MLLLVCFAAADIPSLGRHSSPDRSSSTPLAGFAQAAASGERRGVEGGCVRTQRAASHIQVAGHDISYSVLVDIRSVKKPSRRGEDKNSHSSRLRRFILSEFVQSRAGRVQLASITKPFVVAHYYNLKVSQVDPKVTGPLHSLLEAG